MTDWIHCNTCFIQPSGGSGRTFVLTSCGHLYCDLCNKKIPRTKCAMCSCKFSVTQLGAQMPVTVKNYFTDPSKLLSEVTKVTMFQKQHRERFMKHNKEKLVQQTSLLTQANRDKQVLTEENKYLKAAKTGSPIIGQRYSKSPGSSMTVSSTKMNSPMDYFSANKASNTNSAPTTTPMSSGYTTSSGGRAPQGQCPYPRGRVADGVTQRPSPVQNIKRTPPSQFAPISSDWVKSPTKRIEVRPSAERGQGDASRQGQMKLGFVKVPGGMVMRTPGVYPSRQDFQFK